MHTEELKKLRRAKDERNVTAHLVQKASIDKMNEEKMNLETMFKQRLPVILRSRGQLVLNYMKQQSNNISWNEQRQMSYKDDDIENSNMIDLLTWLHCFCCDFVVCKAIAECNVPLEWIKNKDILTMIKMIKESNEELMEDTSITSSKLLEKPEDEIKWEEFKPYKKPRKSKK